MAGHGKPKVRLGERGGLSATGLHFGIIVSEFNNFITDRLLAGALEAFASAGARKPQLEIVRVPGAFELPIAAKKLAETRRFDSLVCIGCVLRGETSHYDFVCSETARGIQLAQLDTGVPIGFCVLTCDTREQALARAGMTLDDVHVVEINEAFAAQVIPSARGIGLDPFDDRLNPHGGAIALGHPFGMTGARILCTLLNDLQTAGASIGLETMCVGGGQGMAMIVERLN